MIENLSFKTQGTYQQSQTKSTIQCLNVMIKFMITKQLMKGEYYHVKRKFSLYSCKVKNQNSNKIENQIKKIASISQMSMSQSKLMLQLSKQQKVCQKAPFSQQKIQDLYSTISKLQPKNLMLIEFLTLMIQKNLIKNSHKVFTFLQLYEQIKGKKLQQQHSSFTLISKSPNNTTYSTGSNSNSYQNPSQFPNGNNTQLIEKEEQKFSKKKFLKLLKDVAKLVYPGDPKGYEVTLYLKLVMPDAEENRMKVDDNLRKFLNQQTIGLLQAYNKQFQTLFQVYMPQNYNHSLGFSWNQIRLLQKRLPIVCLLKILYQSQLCPQLISQIQLLEIISKMIPPLNSNHKEVMFYYSDTFNTYMREYIGLEEIKLLEGDIGLTFFEMQMVLVRVATEMFKDAKQEVGRAVDKLMACFGVTEIVKNKKQLSRMHKLQSVVLSHLKATEQQSPSNPQKPKSYIKKKTLIKKENQQLTSLYDQPPTEQLLMRSLQNQKPTEKSFVPEVPFKKLQHESMLITRDDLLKVKGNLDDQLGPVPEKVVIDKENQGYFNVNEKFTVIGQQLPKLQEKNKPAAKPNSKDKPEDVFLGFKPEDEPKQQSLTKSSLMLNRKKKLRMNTQHPIILTEVFYPTSFSDPSLIQLKQEQEIFLQTTYIHLGERMYEQAYVNFQKAQRLIKAKRLTGNQVSILQKKQQTALEFYFEILEAQIFQAAGKDEAALMHYYNARQISFNFQASEASAKAYTYMGLSSTLYHLEQYEFALRCLLKAKEIYGDSLQLQSIQNAILLNNIGSCYMMLNRNQQAVKYFNVSHQVLDLKVGRFDERTLVVQQNISKNKKAYIQQMPSFKTMWKTYVQKNNNLAVAKTTKKVKK